MNGLNQCALYLSTWIPSDQRFAEPQAGPFISRKTVPSNYSLVLSRHIDLNTNINTSQTQNDQVDPRASCLPSLCYLGHRHGHHIDTLYHQRPPIWIEKQRVSLP